MSYVLVVDDDARARTLLCRLLEPAGQDVREAESAEEAIGLVTDLAPVVAFCDVHMPGANGLWLADQIRSLSPTTAMVLATGDPQVPPFESLRPGIVAYLVKPLERDAILRALDVGIQWSLQRQIEREAATSVPTPRLDQPQQVAGANESAQSPAQLLTALDGLRTGFQVIDPTWRYVYVNPAAAAHNRRTPAQLIGRTMMEVFPGIEDLPVFAVLKYCMTERVPNVAQTLIAFADGQSRWFEVRVEPSDEGLLVYSRDIHERILSEQIQRPPTGEEDEEEHVSVTRRLWQALWNGPGRPAGS